jgi:hypothetical protein
MRSLRSLPVLPVLLIVSLLVSWTAAWPSLADDGDAWVRLGDLHVRDRVDRDTLEVGVKKGRFEAIQIRVEGRAVQFHNVEVHFENGDVQDVPLRSVIRAGGRSRVIDLEGGKRAIDRIVFLYDAQTRRRGRGARVAVFGRR